ncbi:MAG: metal-dependent hydrolase YbeY [Segetibacter sp.]|jgi:probable rRNA maturation factor|nr:metal-dependent hydrolase YbeY [Segetibacter sp.]
MPGVRFNYADVKPISLNDKKGVKDFVVSIFNKEGRPLKKINYIFCSDEYLLEINKSYLQHDYYTDIITFDLSEQEGTIGEIYISVDRVKENSKSHATSFSTELLRVIFHGALHLIGYKDKKKSEITIMRDKEEYYLRLFETK